MRQRRLVYVRGATDIVTVSEMIPTPRAAEEASELMMRFAERTGLTSDLPKQRYLWTDAFAVCNFLGLAQAPHPSPQSSP